MIYAFPLWGLLYRAHQDPDLFYGWPIYFPQVNAWVVELMGTITIALFIIWCGQRVAYVLRRGRASTPQLTHVALILSHVLITAVSYLWVEEITREGGSLSTSGITSNISSLSGHTTPNALSDHL